jgi:hypothetical protein
MAATRKTSLVAGVFYLVTFISIPTLVLYGPVHDPGYIVGPGADTGVLWGGLLELIVALAGIGTAITLYPVVRRQNEGFALGFVAARVLEAGLIFLGVVSLLAVVALRQDLAGTGAAAPATTGTALVAVYDSAFLVGQSLIPGLNALLLGTLLYRSRLVPRALPVLGLIGAPLQIASVITTMLGVNDRLSVWSAIAVAPIFVWELSLGVYLVVKGFRPSPITAAMAAAGNPSADGRVTV